MNQIAAAHEKELINSGCALHVSVKYDGNHEESFPASPKIVLEIIDSDQKKRRIEVEDFYSPDNTAFF